MVENANEVNFIEELIFRRYKFVLAEHKNERN